MGTTIGSHLSAPCRDLVELYQRLRRKPVRYECCRGSQVTNALGQRSVTVLAIRAQRRRI